MTNRNDSLFLRALRREPTERTPIWLMRQAGRYLPEYRATRARAGSFLDLAGNPELACEVTLQPIERYGFDASILFSDILILPHAMGLGLGFAPGEGPYFERPLTGPADIDALPMPDPLDDTGFVMQAVRLIRDGLPDQTPLIGFAGSPWTVATYMIEGRSSKDFARAKQLLLAEPEAAHRLMNHLADATAAYLSAQVEAGADALMVFDSWGGVLSPRLYREFSLASQQRIVDQVREKHPATPIILFGKGCGQHLELLADTGCEGLGVDWTMDLSEARARVGHRVALQGNLDPAVMLTSPEIVAAEARRVLESFGDGPGHIFNLGHGITPAVDPDNVTVLVETVRAASARQDA
ncbi:uroporphyrinogen decarboxylase [Wenzhouxiangella limi]|uniref:Uroporphyrinogen decarboxylase n=1 Tax=Wenzhouxiangella limi TaxID=2707351 RepID=A0A845UZ39_9GAMM|nr:uroporphyrinogen decarboxylase [Wenzhouxiangella limi]NDY95552.1 uroporphyrinogen decarboxylase [Wenzhouxiangella limi]